MIEFITGFTIGLLSVLFYRWQLQKNIYTCSSKKVTNTAVQTLVRVLNHQQEEHGENDDDDELITGSAEDFVYTCEYCEHGIDHEATAYCRNCRQFLCTACESVHKNCAVTKWHSTITIQEYEDHFRNGKQLFDKTVFQISKVQSKKCKKCYFAPGQVFVCAGQFVQTNNQLTLIQSGWDCTHTVGHFLAINPFTSKEYQLPTVKSLETISYYDRECLKRSQFCYNEDGTKIFFTMSTKQAVYRYEDSVLKLGQYREVFTIDGQCNGIALFDSGLALSVYKHTNYDYNPDWHIRYLTFTGKLKKKVVFHKDGTALFSSARHIASNFEEDTLYVSDSDNHRITALDAMGNVLFTFTSATMRCPRGLCTDMEGNVYIACKLSVIQLDRDGSKSRPLLQVKNKKRTDTIKDVFFHRNSQKLAIIEDNETACVFEFL